MVLSSDTDDIRPQAFKNIMQMCLQMMWQ